MALGLKEIGMPESGLFRAGRWSDVATYPPPVDGMMREIFEPGGPLVDGYPRWEDAWGRFGTAKLSATSIGAIGRTIAGYRRFETGGVNILDKIKGFFDVEPDNTNEPLLVANQIPPDYFQDAHRLELPYDEDLRFIDVDDPESLETLSGYLAAPLQVMEAQLDDPLGQERDRRITRLAMSTVYNLCVNAGYRHIAGIRYGAEEPEWDAYVSWKPPQRVDLTIGETSPIFPEDDDLLRAAEILGLEIP